jgi:hypothetical protein
MEFVSSKYIIFFLTALGIYVFWLTLFRIYSVTGDQKTEALLLSLPVHREFLDPHLRGVVAFAIWT